MSRTAKQSLARVAVLLVAGLSLAACRDVAGPSTTIAPHKLSAMRTVLGPTELTLTVGDTLNVSEAIVDDQFGEDWGFCQSDDASVASVYNFLSVVGQQAGDITLSCARTAGDDGAGLNYRITVHVKAAESQPAPQPEPQPIEPIAGDP